MRGDTPVRTDRTRDLVRYKYGTSGNRGGGRRSAAGDPPGYVFYVCRLFEPGGVNYRLDPYGLAESCGFGEVLPFKVARGTDAALLVPFLEILALEELRYDVDRRLCVMSGTVLYGISELVLRDCGRDVAEDGI